MNKSLKAAHDALNYLVVQSAGTKADLDAFNVILQAAMTEQTKISAHADLDLLQQVSDQLHTESQIVLDQDSARRLLDLATKAVPPDPPGK